MQTARTDDQMQREVISELGGEPSVHADRIGVTVHDGIVTLTGHVDSWTERLDAEAAALRVAGLTTVCADVDVTLPRSSRRSDAEIRCAALRVLRRSEFLPQDAIEVTVHQGWVALSGDVNWKFQRQAAVRAVRYVVGVTGISDCIAVDAILSPVFLAAQIEDRLNRRDGGHAPVITVEVHGADVTLSGTVANWWERELAKDVVRSTAGVLDVTDHITVSA